MKEPISVQAIFSRAVTTADGGWRISFDLSQEESDKISEIAKLSQEIINLVIMTPGYVSITPIANSKGD